MLRVVVDIQHRRLALEDGKAEISCMRLRRVLVPLILLAFSACNLVREKCTYEVRSLVAAGEFDDAGVALVAAQVLFSETRGSLQYQSMSWSVTGSAKGHVLSASFKDINDLSQVLLDLPLASADRPEIAQGAADTRAGAHLEGFRDIIAAGHGVIEVQTDLPARGTVTVQLTPTTVGDWIRPDCG
jgi:hypothetical protein